MSHQGLITTVAALLQEQPDALHAVGITDELNLQGWLSARNLRMVLADPREAEISPGFWIAEHHDGHCVVMYDESPYGQPPSDVRPSDLKRALVLVPLDPSRPSGTLPPPSERAAGTVEALLTAPSATETMEAHQEAELVAGRGIVGDRYFDGTGTFSVSEKHGQELTLIEGEVLDALRADGLDLSPADARRNVVTRGIDLNALVGQEFNVGAIRCIGRRLCEPCSHLQRLTGEAVLRPLVHRGGLRADILSSGTVHVGDKVNT